MDYPEAAAKRLLEHFVPGSRMVYQASQSKGEHDFNLHYPDGRMAAAEVTSVVDATLQETWRQIVDKRKGGSAIRTQLSKKSWHITLSANTRIDPLRKNVDEYLARIEEAGIDTFHGLTDPHPGVKAIYAKLGVTSGSTAPDWIKPPRILMGLPGPPSRLVPTTPIDAALREAWKPDNRSKLGARMDGERHLAVYAPINSLAWFGLADFEPPPAVATLPPEISDIWIFGEGDPREEFVVWRSGTTSPWIKLIESREAVQGDAE